MKTLKQIQEMADTHSFHPDWKERVHARGATKYTFHPSSKRTTAETKDGHIVGTWNHEHSEGHIMEGVGSHLDHVRNMTKLNPDARKRAETHYAKATAAGERSDVDTAKHHWGEYDKVLGEGHGAFADWARENKAAKDKAREKSKPYKPTPEARALIKQSKENAEAHFAHHIIAGHIASHVPDVDPIEMIQRHAIKHHGVPAHKVMAFVDRLTRKHLGAKSYNHYFNQVMKNYHSMNGGNYQEEITLKRPGAQRILESMVVNSGPDVQLLKRFKKKGSNPVKESSDKHRYKIGDRVSFKHPDLGRVKGHVSDHYPDGFVGVTIDPKKGAHEVHQKDLMKEDFIDEAGTKAKPLGVIRGKTATGQKANPINVKPELRNPRDKKHLKSFRTLGR